MTAAKIARALLRGRKSGAGYIACCPAHEDHNPSLSLKDGEGKLLVCCHAGCSQETVIAKLKEMELWPEHDSSKKSRIVEVYDYTSASGHIRYQVVRTDPKGFYQRKPDATGGWTNRGPTDREKLLYRLPEVIEAPIVFVVEGEKDVETLRAHGFVATTNAGGAKAIWLPQYTEVLKSRECIIIPDNDRPGWRRAASIGRALLGVAERIRVLDLPPETKDISDWFAGGHSDSELIALLEGVHAL
ncbi:MAG: hypothetical protein LAP61_00555 [Acidobacteriia bacterium]|nr:hypothetical protein [Terriglobia bacterium]